MNLDELTITNFRCFGPEKTKIHFTSGITTFVGGNGSGKTAAFQALARLFGISPRQRSVQKRDFHVSPGNPELISGSLLELEAVFSFPELDRVDQAQSAPAVSEFFNQMAASGPGDPLKVRIRLQAKWTDDGTPDGNVEEDVRWITALDDDFKWNECKRMQAAERGAIQLVYVPARRDADSQVIALLKGRLWKAARWSQDFQNSVSTSAKALQESFEKEIPAQFVLKRLAERWSQVHEADTEATPAFHLVENRFEELVHNAMFAFSPDEAGTEREVGELSDGQRSLLHIALTVAILEIERDAFQTESDVNPFEINKFRQVHLTILAIEEPENSLSPFFLSRITNQARDIAMLPTAQVALSSHAPAILARIEPEEVRYFRLDRKLRKSTVKEIALPNDDIDASQFVRRAVQAHPELYFARFVILGEGESERVVIPRVAKAMGVDFDPSFVPIVPLGGRYVDHFWRLLSTLDIPFATLLDLDLGRRHGGANMIRETIKSLVRIENAFGIDHEERANRLTDNELCGIRGTIECLNALATQNVFFSYPIDIDFSMLQSFGKEYKFPNPGGKGPRKDGVSVQEKKSVTLKTGGNPAFYGDVYDETFAWYPYLFLNRSKLETHFAALARISDDDLANSAPPEILALIQCVRTALWPGDGDE